MSEQSAAEEYLARLTEGQQQSAQAIQYMAQEIANQRQVIEQLSQRAAPQQPAANVEDLNALDQSILKGLTQSPSRVFAEFAGSLRKSIQEEYQQKLREEMAAFQNHAATKEFERDWLARNRDIQADIPVFENYLGQSDVRQPYTARVEQAAQWTRQWREQRFQQEAQAQQARARAASMPAPGGYDPSMMGMTAAAVEKTAQEQTQQYVTDMKAWQAARRHGVHASRAA